MKKIMFYSQNLAGMGHLVRSTEIIRSLVPFFDVYFIHGGQEVPGFQMPQGVTEIRLPGLCMEGPHLKVVDASQSLEVVLGCRTRLLLEAFQMIQPDCLITEGFPFSKHTLRFELIPLLKYIEAGNYPTKVVCCLRDIIMTQAMSETARAKKQVRTCKWINRYYSLILYHSDPDFQRLDTVFSEFSQLEKEVFYTGFVAPERADSESSQLGSGDELDPSSPSIVVSVGGGRHGYELLSAIATVAPSLQTQIPHTIHAFAGPYLPEAEFLQLQGLAECYPNLVLRRFTPHLMDYLRRAALSISLGGYNTTMNILKTGVRSLIYPSPSDDQSGEQTLRAQKLEKLGILSLLTRSDLAPEPLTQRILMALSQQPTPHALNLQGAQQSMLRLRSLLEAEVSSPTQQVATSPLAAKAPLHSPLARAEC